ncbi:hypothetical protein DPMN_123891 [Dreissena polymorpha]|uniref:Uncharacterized protein n=1 Tax=Dreissena polymorpha TaxID=45954 RepID=A0A9D4GV49_DREPO|nr:hypothetical protein DPMN_123891 [Dreissena polymorpha]
MPVIRKDKSDIHGEKFLSTNSEDPDETPHHAADAIECMSDLEPGTLEIDPHCGRGFVKSDIDRQVKSVIDRQVKSDKDRQIKSDIDRQVKSDIDRQIKSDIDRQVKSDENLVTTFRGTQIDDDDDNDDDDVDDDDDDDDIKI